MHTTDDGNDLPPTAMLEMEVLALERCARDKYCLELGAEYGHSTVVMGRIAKQVVSVDWHRGYPDCPIGPKNQDTLLNHFYNIKSVRDTVISIVGKFEDVLPYLRPAMFDFIFLDGGHDWQQVMFCFQQAYRLLTPDGTLACHDYGHPLTAEKPVADELSVYPRIPVVGSLAVFERFCEQYEATNI